MGSNSDNKNFSKSESQTGTASGAPVLTGEEIGGATPVYPSKYNLDAEIAIGSAIFETVRAWIEGLRMRLKIRRDLGRKVARADFSSIDTWMKVDEVEQRKRGDKPKKSG